MSEGQVHVSKPFVENNKIGFSTGLPNFGENKTENLSVHKRPENLEEFEREMKEPEGA